MQLWLHNPQKSISFGSMTSANAGLESGSRNQTGKGQSLKRKWGWGESVRLFTEQAWLRKEEKKVLIVTDTFILEGRSGYGERHRKENGKCNVHHY